jgi:hypothetical protein
MWWRIARSLVATTRHEVKGELIIELKGLLANDKDVHALREIFWSALREGNTKIIFDARQLRTNTFGVRKLVETQKIAESNFLKVVLVGTPKGISIPDSVNLSTAFRIAADIKGGSLALATM